MKLGTVVRWVVFGLLLLMALPIAAKSLLAAFAFVLAALVIAPIAQLDSAWRLRKINMVVRGIGAFVLFSVGCVMVGPTKPDGTSSVAAPSPAVAPPAAEPTVNASSAKRDFAAVYTKLLRDVRQCDSAYAEVSDGLSAVADDGITRIELYQRTEKAKGVCLVAQGFLQNWKVPPSIVVQRGELSRALLTCSSAYGARGDALEKLLPFLDGDSRPSRGAAIADSMKASGGQVVLCVTGLMQVGLALGYTGDELAKLAKVS